MSRRALVAVALAIGTALAVPAAASAHGLVQRADLPIPDWLFTWGASLVLIVSFVGLSLAWKSARLEDERWRPAPAPVSRLLVNPVTEALAGAIGVFLLGVVVWSGLYGTEAPDRNVSVTLVFITTWLGFVALSVLFGDLFRAFNPWRAVGRAVGGVFEVVAGQSAPPPLRYPDWLGHWPAVAGLAGFAWLELAWGAGGFQVVGLTPHTAAVATLVYTVWTFVGMALFGTERWVERGETFSVYFGMFARMAPLSVRDGRLGFRRLLTGLGDWAAPAGSLALVLLAIGSTAFDGASEGLLLEPILTVNDWLVDIGFGPTAALRSANTILLAASIGAVAALYWAGINGMHTVRTELSTRELARRFAHAFVPIALAYVVAHYFSLFFLQEQAQFGYLLSDPLGNGSDYFGTAGRGIDFGSLGAELTWYVQVGSLVVGHVMALVLGHDRALTIYGDARTAARSQYWMLAMMVGFTSLGLYLLSQANG